MSVAIGQINRVHSHIRAVAKKMPSQVKSPLTTTKIQEIIEALTERTFMHGHSIGRYEAKQVGLQVENMDETLEKLCWDLFLQYETDLQLNSFADPRAYFETDDQDEYNEKNAIIACVESVTKCHEFSGPLQLKKVRPLPPQIDLNITVPIQHPQNILSQNISTQMQQMLQHIQQKVAKQVRSEVAKQLESSMPVTGIDLRNKRMTWREVKD